MPLSRRIRAFVLWSIAIASTVPVTVGAQTGVSPAGAQTGQRVILVTGSTDGLGREVALRLAAGGAHVIVHGRNRERGEAVVREIEVGGSGSARFLAADLGSLAEIRNLAATLLREYEHIDVIVNNAGIWLNRSDERQLSADGHELHFAVNYLAGYALTRLLLPRMLERGTGRIINVASAAQAPIDFGDPMLESGYSGGRAYAQSKLAQVMFTIDLARDVADTDIVVAALHPATLMDTPMVREAGVRARSTIDEGADAVVSLVNGIDVESGTYYNGMEPSRANAQAYDDTARAKLRALSEKLARGFTYDQGGITRGPRDRARIALILTGGEYAEGATAILDALAERRIHASFFVTGDFIRTPGYDAHLRRIVAEGHYLGPHSDAHPLYAPWDDRATTLISEAEFREDIERNLSDLAAFGRTPDDMRYFIPPYEWYNEQIADWSARMGLVLFNYTPGTRSNADYMPDDDPRFISSAAIARSILDYESAQEDGLNGFLLLLHVGAGPDRTDGMHAHVPDLIDELMRRGYTFVRIDELLE